MRVFLALVAGIGLGVVGSVLLSPRPVPPPMVPVVVAKIDLTAGEILDPESQLAVVHCQMELCPPGRFRNVEELRSKTLWMPVKKGHVVFDKDVGSVDRLAHLFPKDITPCWRAFSIRVRQPDILVPGARVDVIALAKDRSKSFVWEDVEVLVTDTRRKPWEQVTDSEYQTIVLLATIEEVKRFAAQYPEDGYCMVAIRNPRDKAKGP